MSYEVSTDYSGRAYLDVDVKCRVEIEYKGTGTYSTRYDFSTQDESHNLYAHGREDGSLSFNFYFSPYEEVVSVKISSAKFEIDSIYLF